MPCVQASWELARIANAYPGRVAAIEMHVSFMDTFYIEEANQRKQYYPPPYGVGGNWFYTVPWLWFDGDKHCDLWQTWEAKIVNRMMQDAPVNITMGGHFSAAEDTGRVYAHFRNDSTETITGRVVFVITEDSLFHVGMNGDPWHNHVPRDYVPDHNGQVITLPPGDSLTVDQFFTMDTSWVDEMCEIVTWIQNDSMDTDSTKEIWQGGMIKVTDLTGIEEWDADEASVSAISVYPNPCVSSATFVLNIPRGTGYSLVLYDVSGRLIRTLSGRVSSGGESLPWNLCDRTGTQVSSGVYFYRFESGNTHATGKLIVE